MGTDQTFPLAWILQNCLSSAGCGGMLLVQSSLLQFPRGMGRTDALKVLKAQDKVHLYNQRGTAQTLPSFSHYSTAVDSVGDAMIPIWKCYIAQICGSLFICRKLQICSCWCLTETLQISHQALQDQFLCSLIFSLEIVGVRNYMYFWKL